MRKRGKKSVGVVGQTLSNYSRNSGNIIWKMSKIQNCEFVKNSTGKTREIKVRQIKLIVKKSSKTRKFEKRQEIEDG